MFTHIRADDWWLLGMLFCIAVAVSCCFLAFLEDEDENHD